MKITGILTEQTCGEACWHAHEDVCRCSCGGRNHGVLCTPGGMQPVRTAKIDGIRYELMAVGPGGDIGRQALKLLNALPPRSVERTPMTTWDDTWGWVSTQMDYKYPWRPNEAGSPYRMKAAKVAQCRKYPELSAYRDMEINEWRRVMPSLLWKKTEKPEGEMR